MRVSLIDLLQITAIAAAYLAGLTWIFGEVRLAVPMQPIFLLMLVQMPLQLGFFAWWQRRKCGRALLSIWKPARWLFAWCFVPFYLFFVNLIGRTAPNLSGHSPAVLLYHGMLLGLIGFTLASKRVVLAEHGFLFELEGLLWNEHRFELVHDGGEEYLLVPRKLARNLRGPRRVQIPTDLIEEVRSILAAKQAEGTTDHTDGHG